MFSIFFISCNGQENKNIREIKTKSTNEIAEASQVDPLFYIEGQLCAWVRKIFQDKNGNLWFGTNHYGVMRYNGDTLEYFSKNEGLGAGRINEIVEDSNGNVWLGTYGGLSKYDGKRFTNFPLPNTGASFSNDVWSILIDSHGIFWLGTTEGVFQFDGEKFTAFPIPKAVVKDTNSIVSYDRITCIIEDRNGTFWFGTDGFGICRYDPSTERTGGQAFSHILKEDGLGDNNIADILEDQQGNIWIGTMYGGVSKYDGNSFYNFTKNGLIEGDETCGFYEDKNGNIWFAAENYGVYRYTPSTEQKDGKSFSNFHKKDGLNTNGIISILEDKEGRFWLGGWGGLFRYDDKSFFSVTRDGPWEND